MCDVYIFVCVCVCICVRMYVCVCACVCVCVSQCNAQKTQRKLGPAHENGGAFMGVGCGASSSSWLVTYMSLIGHSQEETKR